MWQGKMMVESGLPLPIVEDGSDASDHETDKNVCINGAYERRRTRIARFNSWMSRAAEHSLRTQVGRQQKSAADEELSIRSMLAQSESQPIITDPREYQIELYERAKTQNTIAVLDTGSGKTLIAVLLLRHIIDQELEDRHQGKPSRVAFFLVPSVTLVFQQSAVLETNLDHSIGRFCGAMKCKLWTQEVWDKHFQENKVIVCTADILRQCLQHSFIKMRQINLLVFDEAHHAKKGDPYAQIIRDFYRKEPDLKLRPRVFGMTASPVDAKVDVVQAASDLEDMLCSQIATTANMALLQRTITKPYEEVIRYLPGHHEVTQSSLYHNLKDHLGHLRVMKPFLDRAKEINSHMGSWCADLYWTFSLAEKKAVKMESKMQRGSAPASSHQVEEASVDIDHITEAIALVANHDFDRLRLEVPHVSHKVIALYNYLNQFFERPSHHRCIVFVEQRAVARLLDRVFSSIGGENFRSGVLTGSGSGRLDDLQATFRNQVLTLTKFRKGEINCLFATSVAEEGLDVPDCSLIIRFDPCKTMIQYIQSRGRARYKNSRLLHLLELGNSVQDETLRENQSAELLMRRFCEALPADRRLAGDDDSDSLAGLSNSIFEVPTTGAKITFGSSLQLLERFVRCLPSNGDESPPPIYLPLHSSGRFQYEVNLPEKSPLKSVIGLPSNRKAYAKRSAAFEACKQLYEAKYLNEHLVPIYSRRLPLMRNAALALHLKKTGNYAMRTKPTIWEEGRGLMPDLLYLLVIDVLDGLDRPHQPLVLLSRKPMPAFPVFPLFLSKGRATRVSMASHQVPIRLSLERLDQLTEFTLRVFKDLFNKTYEFDTSKVSYWLAPAATHSSADKNPVNIVDLIDWTTVETVHANSGLEWTAEMSPMSLLDRFLVDKWDGGRRFFSTRIASEYHPLDPVPENTASGKWQANILDYTVSLWQKARQSRTWDVQQPVIEAEKVLHRRNLLAEPDDTEDNARSRCFICPEPLKISAIPARVVTMCYAFPGIIHRIESYLIAMEISSNLGLEISAALALEALTKDSDNTEDHQLHERINFQRGMGKNYERLEFLGDCFLKMATSLAVFTQYPDDNEFDFHVKRMLLLCNQNLFNVAQKLKIYEFIRSRTFSRRTWYPGGLKMLEGKGSKNQNEDMQKHQLGDKTIADVCEALMGAAFLTHNQPGRWEAKYWTSAVAAVTKLVDSEDHRMMSWSDYSKAYQKPGYQIATAKGQHLELARQVERAHKYHFRFPRLLRSAFNHPSYPISWSDGIPSYQRLEFLGDSLLDMACIAHLFYNYPDKDPQWLTEHKMAMVSNKFLGAVCVKIGFHKHIRHNSGIMTVQISEYVEELESAERAAKGAKDFWTSIKDPPKCLPDMVEAYVAAIFVDSDFDYNEVQRFFDQHIKPYFDDMTVYDTFANNHPVTRLHSLLSEQFGCEEFQLLVSEEVTGDGGAADVTAGLMIHDHAAPIGAWRAKSGRYAKVKAASLAVEELQGMAAVEFRARYGCDCESRRRNGQTEWT